MGVLAASVPRDVDEAVAGGGGPGAADGKLPPHVMVYFAMALALFADDDYEEVMTRLTETLGGWGCWDRGGRYRLRAGSPRPGSGWGTSRSRNCLTGSAVPVAEELTRGAFLGAWRLMAIDGFEWDLPDTTANVRGVRVFGVGWTAGRRSPRPGSSTISECASHAMVDAEIGPIAARAGEQTLARPLYSGLDEDWLLIADRNFCNYQDCKTAATSGARLLWRVKADLRLPVLGPPARRVLPVGAGQPRRSRTRPATG